MADTRWPSGCASAIQRAATTRTLVAEAVEPARGRRADRGVRGAPGDDLRLRRGAPARHRAGAHRRPGCVVGHTDEHPADRLTPTPYATTSTEAVPLGRVALGRGHPGRRPTRRATGAARCRSEVTVTIGWGAVSRIDLEPAACGDPNCEADHGYTGTATADDLALRVSEAGRGRGAVRQALGFAAALSAATAR